MLDRARVSDATPEVAFGCFLEVVGVNECV